MNLIERKREEHRSRILQRIGSVLVCMSVLLAVAFPPQEAKAFAVVDDAAIAAITSAFLSSCGLTFSASGMDSNGVKEQVGAVIDSYLGEVFDGKSAAEWFGDVAIGYNRGKVLLPAAVGNKLADLARWVKEKYSVEAANSSSVISNYSSVRALLADGSYFEFYIPAKYPSSSAIMPRVNIASNGTILKSGNYTITFANGAKIVQNGTVMRAFDTNGTEIFSFSGNSNHGVSVCGESDSGFLICVCWIDDNSEMVLFMDVASSSVFNATNDMESFQVGYADTLTIPDTIPDSQEVAISTGAASDLTLDQALDQILAAIAEGQLAATKEIAEAGTATGEGEVVTPVEESMPVIAEFGLPELGETLTTRFPFSIPWDVARAVRLLAAPPKTPRFEVDFMAPIRYRFGGNLGDTTVVLDFEEYAIVGQVSRWASTIGFCLLLASGTKKLIWTA